MFNNLHLSGELEYSTNVKTLRDVTASLSCDGAPLGAGTPPVFPVGSTAPVGTVPGNTGAGGTTGTTNPGMTPPIFPSVPGDSPVWDDPFAYPSEDDNDTSTSPFGDDAEIADPDDDPAIFN